MKKRNKKLKKQFKKILQTKLHDNLGSFKEEPIKIPEREKESGTEQKKGYKKKWKCLFCPKRP